MTAPLDFLGFIADDRFGIAYKPRWNAVTGSMAASVLLQQMIFRWAHAGRRPFYKFARPCNHRLYRAGDSWEEELGLKRRELENARDAIAVRTRGEISPEALVSYWVDAQRVTWYALNEEVLLQRFTALYPQSGVGVQLPLISQPDAPSDDLMDETYIGSNGRNVHQSPGELMDETSISSNGRNIHQPMDDPSISTDGRNVHPLYSQQEITSQRSPQTTTAPAAADPPAPAAVAAADDDVAAAAESVAPGAASVAADATRPAAAVPADPRDAILDWIEFDDRLTDKERSALDPPPTLLAWAYWVHLKRAERSSRIVNPVGLVRAQWRKGQQPRADLLRLARGWFALSDDQRGRLLGRLEWAADFGAYDPGDPLDDEYPDIPLSTAAAVYSATGGELGPPALMPAEVVVPAGPAAADPPLEPRVKPAVPPTDESDRLWKSALSELEMQMTRATYTTWLQGTTATLDGDDLTVFCKNKFGINWLENRLDPLIRRAVASVAGRPIPIRYEVRS